jgi:hypothetical protein
VKIAYLLGEDLSKHPGLKHKVETQIRYWQAAGHDVYRIHHFNGTIVHPDGTELELESSNTLFSKATTSKWQRLRLLSTQYEFVVKALTKIKPDLTYSRYLFPTKNAVHISKYAGRLVIEINSDDRAEYLQKRWTTGLFNRLFRHRVLQKADGLIFVTNELANKVAFASFKAERYVIGNGVEIGSFQFLESTKNNSPQLVFIGSPGQSWQGLDKIGILAEQFPEFNFHIIGPDRFACSKLWAQVPANVVFHGYLANDEAQRVIENMDVGISTLSLHRKDMQEACPLKVRQYLAQGLPIIAASADPDIQTKQDFYLQLPNNEQNVLSNLNEIRAFVKHVTGDSNIRRAARRYAEVHLSASKKEAERLKFFEKVLSS